MKLKKLDERIQTTIENGIKKNHRSLFFIVGERAQNQVAVIYNILAKSQIQANPTVLWCYKKELAFKQAKKNRIQHILHKKMIGSIDDSETLFDTFVASSKIRFAFYKDSKKILGNTFGFLVLQDFEAITPNVLALTVETVRGGGVICILLPTLNDLRQLHTLAMDVHARFRTPNFNNVCFRFNERFLLSLNDCNNCLILDDSLTVLPLFSNILDVKPINKVDDGGNRDLEELLESFYDVQPLGLLLTLCKTSSQAKILVKSIELISLQKNPSIVSVTAARGRGKSALLGLMVAGAVSIGLSNIYVVAPSPENLITFFEFVFKGLKVLGYDDKNDLFTVIEVLDGLKLVTSVRIKKSYRQNIQYLSADKFGMAHNAELVVCDEAAAIPLTLVRRLIGPHILFISSTVNGYEGTGRSLSLKLFNELRFECYSAKKEDSNKSFTEYTLQESIRYSDKDPIENWLNKLLCLEDLIIQKSPKVNLCSIQNCSLFYVDRDILFSYHPVAESFLQKLVNIFVSSHYKNSPNDLQMMADAPAHHIFALLPSKTSSIIPEIYCVIQVCFEGGISGQFIRESLDKGKRGAGDIIPWLISQQFCESNFGNLKGARIVRIATNPSYTSMGYGSRAMELLINFFKNSSKISELGESLNKPYESVETIEETILPKSKLSPLLKNVDDKTFEKVEYIGVSYGLTAKLLKFWKRNKFVPVYLRQSANSLTGEYTCVMISSLDSSNDKNYPDWLINYFSDFRSRFMSLLGYSFQNLTSAISLSLLNIETINLSHKELTAEELNYLLTPHDIKRLETYSQNMFDLTYIMDLVPIIAKLCMESRIPDIQKNWIQLAVILSVGLQHRSLNSISDELNIPQNQVVAMFNKVMKKAVFHFNNIFEKNLESEKNISRDISWKEDLSKNPYTQNISIAKSNKRKKVEIV